MVRYRHIILVFTALFVTIPLLVFSAKPVYLVHIYLRPQFLDRVVLTHDKVDIIHEGNNPIFIDVGGSVEDLSIKRVRFSIRPSEEARWYLNDYGVLRGKFLGTAQLGSFEWPINHDEKYSFKINDQDGSLLSEGEINIHVKPIAGDSPFIIALIGIVASILQILTVLFASNEGKHTSRTEMER